MLKLLITVISLVLLSGCTTTAQVSQATRSELAPTGKLRAGLNRGNTLLSAKDPTTGETRGVAVDLAHELGKRIGVPVEITVYDSPGQLAEGAKTGVWDIAFLAVEPARATIISFSPAYAEIDATYLVPKDSLIRSIADVDREGIRVAVAAKTAFDLFLTRSLRHARLIRAKGTPGAFKVFVADNLEALAGLRPTLVAYVDKLPESRLLEGRFTAIQQSVGTPSGRPAAAAYLRDFVAEMNASGFVARAIERHGIRGLSVVASSASAP